MDDVLPVDPVRAEKLKLEHDDELEAGGLQIIGSERHTEQIMSFLMLSVIYEKWKDHLYDLDHLKASIGFRNWGQKDPLVGYKQEDYDMFADLMTNLRKTLASYFFRAQFGPPRRRPPGGAQGLVYSGSTDSPGGGVGRAAQAAGAAGAGASGGSGVDDLGMSARGSGAAGG